MHPLIIAELREERRFAVFAGCGSSGGTGSAGSEGCGFVRRREGLSTQPGTLSRQGRLKTESRLAGGAQTRTTRPNGSSPARSGRAETGFSEAIQKTGISVKATPLSRFLRDNLSRIFTNPLKTLGEKYFRPVPKALRTFFWGSPNRPKTPFCLLFGRCRRSCATAPPRAPVRSRAGSVPVVRLRTRAAPSACRRPSASSAVR